MAFSTTHPVDSYCPRRPLGTEEFKAKLQAAMDAHYPSDRANLPHYDSVSVLLLLWENDHLDLQCINEVERLRDVFAKSYGYSTKISRIPLVNSETWLYDAFVDCAKGKSSKDLLIVYYAGHATAIRDRSPCIWLSGLETYAVNVAPTHFQQSGQQALYPLPSWGMPSQTFTQQSQLNFAKPRDYLCSRRCGVLFLLDCCHAAGTPIGEGKELIAACASASNTRAPEYPSFTTALVQELEHAATSGKYLTAAMLYRSLLQKAFNGSLEFSPMHTELLAVPNPSIFLVPQASSGLRFARPILTTRPNNIPVSVALSVQLRDASEDAAEQLTSWLVQNIPADAEKVKFRASGKSLGGSYTVVFELAVELWYCLVPDTAINFLGFRLDTPDGVAVPEV